MVSSQSSWKHMKSTQEQQSNTTQNPRPIKTEKQTNNKKCKPNTGNTVCDLDANHIALHLTL